MVRKKEGFWGAPENGKNLGGDITAGKKERLRGTENGKGKNLGREEGRVLAPKMGKNLDRDIARG